MQLLRMSKWEKPLGDWITATGVGFLGQEMRIKDAERVERNMIRRLKRKNNRTYPP
jgi:hypothetical protein